MLGGPGCDKPGPLAFWPDACRSVGSKAQGMKRALHRTGLALAGIVALLVLGTVVPRPLVPAALSGEPPSRRIVVLGSPIHNDNAIPIDEELIERFSFLQRAGIRMDHPGARYLVFGWGARAFYVETPTWSDLKASAVAKALTLDSSVMHVDLAGEIDLSKPYAKSFEISDRSMARLQDFIAASFRTGEDGPVRLPGAAYGEFDAFFEAHGLFNALAGCNTWTSKALREAGLRTGWWNPMPQTLAVSLGLYN
jgi:uncharacterized protein (TIGR02117 family)